MKELYIFCEGQTEQSFCKQVLQPHLFPQHDGILRTLPVGWKNYHGVKGIGKYSMLRKFIANTLKSRKEWCIYFTTLIDLYGLPSDFPGKAASVVRNPSNPTPYVEALEEAWGKDISDPRFRPYLQLHEYETLLFAEPEAFAWSFVDCQDQIAALKAIAASFTSIEKINDALETAPSKRISAVFPEYPGRKATVGPDVAEYIGLTVLRAKCPHFDKWLTWLENLKWQAQGDEKGDEKGTE